MRGISLTIWERRSWRSAAGNIVLGVAKKGLSQINVKGFLAKAQRRIQITIGTHFVFKAAKRE